MGGLAVGVLLADCYAALWQDASLIAIGLALLGCTALGIFVAAGGLTLVSLRIARAGTWLIRHRRLSLRIGAVLLIGAGIAIYGWETRLTVNTPLQIQATTGPQTAVFFIAERFPGSLGCGVSGADMRGISVDGKPVFLAEEDRPKVDKRGLLATPLMGYIVRARIHIQPRTLRWSSVPGQPYRECYVVMLDRVFDAVPVTERDFRKLVLGPTR
jgi:hypothetical protein